MFKKTTALALAAVIALLFLAPMAPTALAAKEPEKVYVLLSEKLGYDPNLLLEEVPTVEESGVKVQYSVLKTTYKSEYAKTATIKYYDDGAFERLELESVACEDGTIERLVYQYERERWSYGGTGNDDLFVEYSVVGRLMGYSGRIGKVYCSYDGFGELDYVSSDDNPDLTIEDVLASDLALPELVGDPYDCGFETLAPPVTVYAQFPDLGFDLRAALDAVPDPNELMLLNMDGIPYVALEDAEHVYNDVMFQFDGDFWKNSASHFLGSGTVNDYWLLGDAYQYNFDQKTTLMVSAMDEQDNRVTAFWERTYDEDADEVSLEKLDRLIIRFPEANDHGFTSLEADLATGERTLRNASGDLTLSYASIENVRCAATYNASGALTEYEYRAYDGQMVRYKANGLMDRRYRMSDDPQRRAFYPPLPIDGEVATANAASGDPAALYPPLEIVGGDVTVPAPDPSSLAPDEKVFARLEDTGFDLDALLALAPEDPGITVDDGVITVEDRDYRHVSFYGYIGDDFEYMEFDSVLKDGVWTIDYTGTDLSAGDFWIDCSGNENAEGRRIFLSWTPDLELESVQFLISQPDENGLVGAYYSIKHGDTTIFTENVDASYDEGGNLVYYNYTATDGSYCCFNNYFELAEVYPPDEW